MNIFKAMTTPKHEIVDTTFVSIIERLAAEHDIPQENILIFTKLTPIVPDTQKHVGFILYDSRTNTRIKHLDMKEYL